MYTIKVRMRKLGKKNQGAVEPVEFLLESRPETVKELVEGLVCLGVRQYNERKDTGQIVPWLTSETIQEQAVTGKISFGLRGGNDADADQAVENAVQCFEDGIYRIFEMCIRDSCRTKGIYSFVRRLLLYHPAVIWNWFIWSRA